MTAMFSEFVRQADNDGGVSTDELRLILSQLWPDAAISASEAKALFALNAMIETPDHNWTDFFIEAVASHVATHEPPRGYVSEQNAAWLIAQFEGVAAPGAVLALRIIDRIIQLADRVPSSLEAYALAKASSFGRLKSAA